MIFFDISLNHLVINTVPKLEGFPRPFLRVIFNFLSPTAYDFLTFGSMVVMFDCVKRHEISN